MQGLSNESEFEYDSFVSADSTKLNVNPKCDKRKLEVKDIAWRSITFGVNESYKEMKKNMELKLRLLEMSIEILAAPKGDR